MFRFGQKALNLNLPYYYSLASKIAPIDVLHCHFGPNGILGAYLKKLGLVNKLVVTFHGYDLSMVANGPKHPYKVVFEEADAILPVSERWHKRLLELGRPPSVLPFTIWASTSRRFPTLSAMPLPKRP